MLRELPEDDMQRPWLFDGEDQDKHLAAMPYGACAFLPESAVRAFGQMSFDCNAIAVRARHTYSEDENYNALMRLYTKGTIQ